MTLSISSSFDSGNIDVLGIDDDTATLAIRKDKDSDFYQWFHFRVAGAKGRAVTLRITNCAGAAYPLGWPNYCARYSDDRQDWLQAETGYADGVLTITHTPARDATWFAYHAPFSMERHHDMVARIAAAPGVVARDLGATRDGQPLDCLTIGTGPKSVWLYARQHPGESMAEWWMEGALDLLVSGDPVAVKLREAAVLHIVPNMNPDGSRRGHLRTNAVGVNLNREWNAPTLERSPEVYHVRAAMDATGVDFAMDIHGDEAIPYVFLAGFDGIPSWTPRQGNLYARFGSELAARTADFQTQHGYPTAGPGKANLSMSTNQLAERFGAVAMTLEMPFKDNADAPDPIRGWSPRALAAAGTRLPGNAGWDDRRPMITVRPDDPTTPAAAALIAKHLNAVGETTSTEFRFALGVQALCAPDIVFLTAWEGDALVGMGAIKDLGDGHAEVKSMRTDPDHLRKGVGAAILTALIATARDRGFDQLSLETGTTNDFAPAHALYRRFGFEASGAFADYPSDSPHNCYMTLCL